MASPRWVLTWRRGGAGSLGSPLRGHRSHHRAPPLRLDHLPDVLPPHTVTLRGGDLTSGLWGTQTSVWSGLLCFSIVGGARRAWCGNGKYTDFSGASGTALYSARGTRVEGGGQSGHQLWPVWGLQGFPEGGVPATWGVWWLRRCSLVPAVELGCGGWLPSSVPAPLGSALLGPWRQTSGRAF